MDTPEDPTMTPQLKADITLLDNLLGVEARKPGKAASLPAAIRIVETLEPAGGKQVPVFPASYAGATDQSPPVYDLAGVIYGEVDETIRVKKSTAKVRQIIKAKLCALDSPQSQANRMEPAFIECDDLKALVPQATSTIPRRPENEGSTSVLLLAHRVADFRIRLSNGADDIRNAVTAFAKGDALPLLQSFPTSLLFGFWDSRDQGTKHARILLSRIDATNVIPCRRHALYSGPYSADEFGEAVLGREADKDKLSELGFSAAPSEGLGGVIVDSDGEISRLSLLSLSDLARINCELPKGEGEAKTVEPEPTVKSSALDLTNAARRYLFALAALAEGHERSKGSHRLRSGCELVLTAAPKFELCCSPQWKPAPSKEESNSGEPLTDKAAVEALYFNRERLIAVAVAAAKTLKIDTKSVKSYEVSKDSLSASFGTAPAPATNKAAKKSASKKAASTTESTSTPEATPAT
jgi:CRISPR-associated protein Csb1